MASLNAAVEADGRMEEDAEGIRFEVKEGGGIFLASAISFSLFEGARKADGGDLIVAAGGEIVEAEEGAPA